MMSEWYELRVEGSAGTPTGVAQCATEGIAMDDNGRLCALASERAKRFKGEREAIEFLFQTTISRGYPFAVVRCGATMKKHGSAA